MPGFLCDFLNEAVILSDGRVTTCCLDPLARNVFGSIFEDDFQSIEKKYQEVVASITQDVLSMPRCRICYDKIAAAGFPETGTYKTDFTPSEQELFLRKTMRLRQLVIEPTCLCNLKCNGCMQGRQNIPATRHGNFLDLDAVDTWLAKDVSQIEAIRLYNYGETFLHDGATAFVTKLKQANTSLHIDIATNGLLLNTPQKRKDLVSSGVDVLYFSIHGGREASIQKYMTQAFSRAKVLDILSDLASVKKKRQLSTPKLVWKYLLFSWNDSLDEIDEAMAQAQRVGVDAMVFAVPGYPSPSPFYRENTPLVSALTRQYQQLVSQQA